MNIYKIYQSQVGGWDTYDAAIVFAESEEQAKAIHPSDLDNNWDSSTWVDRPGLVKATLIGVANPGVNAGVVLASFNAG